MTEHGEKDERQFDPTALMTWPTMAVTLNLLPWHWRLIPRGWYDSSPRREGHAGWWGIDGEWLFIKVTFGFNLPLFDSPWTHPIAPADVCRHCGKSPEADGDHTCSCPYPDDFCPDHPRSEDPWDTGPTPPDSTTERRPTDD